MDELLEELISCWVESVRNQVDAREALPKL